MQYRAENLEETQNIARDFISQITPTPPNATVVGLYGELGAGKTSFTQGVARALGISESIVSPTFVIEKIYPVTHPFFTHLVHIDAYRLESDEELLVLNWKDIISNPKNIVLIEWPEKVSGIMPAHYMVQLAHNTDSTRTITISDEPKGVI
jgi:tRNA threonylcarbamoyladenosine biosynthesis protein TsaE